MNRKLRIAAIIALPIALGAAALNYAAGPGTLDILDRLTPGAGGARVAAGEAFGSHGQRLDVWRSGDAKPERAPVLVFFHGGGWVKGDRQSYGWAARAYASRGFVVVVPDYRKVPQVRFPAFVEDGAEVVRWTHDNVVRFGGDPERIAIAGHSAGGHTVAMLTLDPQWLAKAGAPGAVKAAVGLSGPYDFYPFTGRAVKAMGQWPRPQETQPLAYARTDAPPMMLVTGTEDTTVRPKNARNLTARLRSLGAPVMLKEYAGQGHEDIAMALSLPFRGKAPVLDDSVAFLRQAMPAQVTRTASAR
jgi:acetyl esterase/lipase